MQASVSVSPRCIFRVEQHFVYTIFEMHAVWRCTDYFGEMGQKSVMSSEAEMRNRK